MNTSTLKKSLLAASLAVLPAVAVMNSATAATTPKAGIYVKSILGAKAYVVFTNTADVASGVPSIAAASNVSMVGVSGATGGSWMFALGSTAATESTVTLDAFTIKGAKISGDKVTVDAANECIIKFTAVGDETKSHEVTLSVSSYTAQPTKPLAATATAAATAKATETAHKSCNSALTAYLGFGTSTSTNTMKDESIKLQNIY